MAEEIQQKQILISEHQLQQIIVATVNATLTKLGIEHEDPFEMQRDFSHLRDWRTSMERIKSRTMISAVGIAMLGIAAALWLGFKKLVLE